MEDYRCDCTRTISVKAVIAIDGRILLLRDSHGHVDLPGGRMRCNEDIARALRREIREELGVDGRLVGVPICAFTWHNSLRGSHGVILVYRFACRNITKSSFSAKEPGFSVLWVDKRKLTEQPFPSLFKHGYKHLSSFR